MKTKAESVSGKVSIWAVPTSEFDREYHKKGAFEYQLFAGTAQPWRDGSVQVVEHDVVLPVPAGVDLVMAAVETLFAAKAEVMAHAVKECEKLDKKIKELQLITYQPEEGSIDGTAG